MDSIGCRRFLPFTPREAVVSNPCTTPRDKNSDTPNLKMAKAPCHTPSEYKHRVQLARIRRDRKEAENKAFVLNDKQGAMQLQKDLLLGNVTLEEGGAASDVKGFE